MPNRFPMVPHSIEWGLVSSSVTVLQPLPNYRVLQLVFFLCNAHSIPIIACHVDNTVSCCRSHLKVHKGSNTTLQCDYFPGLWNQRSYANSNVPFKSGISTLPPSNSGEENGNAYADGTFLYLYLPQSSREGLKRFPLVRGLTNFQTRQCKFTWVYY